MKTTDIKADGTVYWYEKGNDWGRYVYSAYDRGPVKRTDDKRFTKVGFSYVRPTYREDPKGKYIRVERVEDEYREGQPLYVLPGQIRDTYAAVKTRYEENEAAKKTASAVHATQLAAVNERADALRERLVNLGLDSLIHVSVIGQNTWSGTPGIKAELLRGTEDELLSLLNRIDDQL